MTDKLEIFNERRYPVAPAILFDAFADPDKLALWWGPHGFTNRIDAFDFQVGGDWRLTMTSSDGTDFANRWTFQEIERPVRIVALHHEPMHVFTLEMTFEPADAGTSLRWRMLFEPTDENRQLQKFIRAANEQNLDRLEHLLEQKDR
ncbi:SRPBCC domain-containing protein [Rhizobium glycinendophyticum]|uniref:ATPase n=1 Tax=Rhizobium glycinendophyticum TaxID=2589807 RepID=A0A504UAP5_9HYPH|nr:SRPBCC domain-containing protein [Rhizobium glycinendophyticum]TPP11559.1 ATPase [Rhizobium glycinendophyticum]